MIYSYLWESPCIRLDGFASRQTHRPYTCLKGLSEISLHEISLTDLWCWRRSADVQVLPKSSVATSWRRNYPSPKFAASKRLLVKSDVAPPYHTQPSGLRNPMLNVKPCREAKGCVRTQVALLLHRPEHGNYSWFLPRFSHNYGTVRERIWQKCVTRSHAHPTPLE